MTKAFWKATLIRCIRTFLTTILGVWTVGTLVTDIDWKATLLSAFSTTLYIFIVCIVGGLPEVDDDYSLMDIEEPEDSEVFEDEDE